MRTCWIVCSWVLLFSAASSYPRASAQEATNATAAERPTIWTNPEGKEIEADFVRITENGVVLRLKANDREAEVPFSSLSIQSHYQAMKLANPAAFTKPLIKAPIPVEVAEPAFTLDPQQLLRFPFPDNPTIEQYLATIKTELDADNPFVLWHCLPPKMQEDFALIVEKGFAKVGPSMLAQVRTILGNLDTIVLKKRDFVFEHPAVASNPMVSSGLKTLWPQIAGLVGAIADESHWQPENFKKENVASSLAGFIAQTVPYAAQFEEPMKALLPPEIAAQVAASDQEFTYNIVSQSADSAEVDVTLANQPPHKLYLQKVGKIWVPGKEFNQIRKGLDEALAAVDKPDNAIGGQAQVALFGINGVIGALAIADSQEKFNETVDTLITMLQGLNPAGMAAGPPGRQGGARGSGRPGRGS